MGNSSTGGERDRCSGQTTVLMELTGGAGSLGLCRQLAGPGVDVSKSMDVNVDVRVAVDGVGVWVTMPAISR